jgi:2,4-dienoyl-CoA reductase-like NADH-dependent reductase (Old Yellow Enzyme family)
MRYLWLSGNPEEILLPCAFNLKAIAPSNMSSNPLQTPFELPCGAVIKNRLVKAAMTERMGDQDMAPTEKLLRLYETWNRTGAGLLITGNVMVDTVHVESAGNVYLGDESILPKLQQWAAAATANHTHVWPQISHAGRQATRFVARRPLAPSEVQLELLGLFGKPRAMTEADIQDLIKRFVKAAVLCKKAGFTGIQFHSAHGYLLNQFLSPKTNHRTDQWGGSIENRSRLLRTIIEEARQALGPEFPISVKLNSSDFQRGGFTEEESLQVIQMLEGKIDLLEISGGTYEEMVFFEINDDPAKTKESTRQREAYFIEFSQKVRAVSQIPLLITGGFRSADFCNQVLADGEVDLIGMARPFLTDLDDIPAFLENKLDRLKNLSFRSGIKVFNSSSEAGFYTLQMRRIANGKPARLTGNALWTASFYILYEMSLALRKRRGKHG